MSTNEDLRPQFWVLRSETNTMVPLIAVDELPPTINIRGVPRSLEAKDLTGMTCAGPADSRHRTYLVDMPNEPVAIRAPPTSTGLDLSDSIFATPFFSTPTQPNPNIFPPSSTAYGISEQMPGPVKSPITGKPVPVVSFTHVRAPVTAPLRIDRNPGPNPLPPRQDPTCVPVKAGPGVKEYCSYWLRCGECDYAQQGCLYKHEMPLDRRVLERLGHRDIPKWYRDRHGRASFLVGGPGEKGERMERCWRNAREAEDRERERERDGGGGHGQKQKEDEMGESETLDARGSRSRVGTISSEKRLSLWKEDWDNKERKKNEKKQDGDGRFAPKSVDTVAAGGAAASVSAGSSPVASKMSPGPTSRGPAGRPSPRMATASGHYQSVLARKTDEACLAALEADRYAKEREMEDLKRLRGHELLLPTRRAVFVTPETSSGDDSEDGRKGG